MKNANNKLTITKLVTNNVKKIRAVEIEPNGELVIVSGKNGQGKSSLIDSIWLALVESRAKGALKNIIRNGEQSATVELELSDGESRNLKITKTWIRDASKPRLVVSDCTTGAQFQRPQTLLNTLIGELSFDPLEFSRLKQSEQIEYLLDASGRGDELRALETDRREFFESRTEINRDVKRLSATLESMPDHGPDFHTMIDADDVIEKISEHAAIERRVAERKNEWDVCKQRAFNTQQEIAELERKLAAANERFLDEKQLVEDSEIAWSGEHQKLVSLDSIDELKTKLAGANEHNKKVTENENRKRVIAELEKTSTRARIATDDINTIDEQKEIILSECDLPLDGLKFDWNNGVMFDGIPISDCSAAQQIRISTAIAISLNRDVNIVRIADGSLLDSESLSIIADLAHDSGCQIWMEIVDESGENGIVIDDGAVVQ